MTMPIVCDQCLVLSQQVARLTDDRERERLSEKLQHYAPPLNPKPEPAK